DSNPYALRAHAPKACASAIPPLARTFHYSGAREQVGRRSSAYSMRMSAVVLRLTEVLPRPPPKNVDMIRPIGVMNCTVAVAWTITESPVTPVPVRLTLAEAPRPGAVSETRF